MPFGRPQEGAGEELPRIRAQCWREVGRHWSSIRIFVASLQVTRLLRLNDSEAHSCCLACAHFGACLLLDRCTDGTVTNTDAPTRDEHLYELRTPISDTCKWGDLLRLSGAAARLHLASLAQRRCGAGTLRQAWRLGELDAPQRYGESLRWRHRLRILMAQALM